MFDEEDEGVENHGEDGEAEELPCPACGEMVYEEAQQCPHCGEWIMPHAAASRTPNWMRWVGVLVILALLLAVMRGVFRVF